MQVLNENIQPSDIAVFIAKDLIQFLDCAVYIITYIKLI